MIGMLWFDNDREATLEKKIERAAIGYQTRYGEIPTVCVVNPCMVGLQAVKAPLLLRTSGQILPNYFLIWDGQE
jgi:hypothetical protein